MTPSPADFFGLIYTAGATAATDIISFGTGTGPLLFTSNVLPGTFTLASAVANGVTSLPTSAILSHLIKIITPTGTVLKGDAVKLELTGWTTSVGVNPDTVYYVRDVYSSATSGDFITLSLIPGGPKQPLAFTGTGTITVYEAGLPSLSAAEADPTTGNAVAVLASIAALVHSRWERMLPADRPSKVSISRNLGIARNTGEVVTTYSITVASPIQAPYPTPEPD